MDVIEYSVTIPGTVLSVCISKSGGGTIGKFYTGGWSYRITGGGVWIEGEDLITGTPRTHTYVAALVPTFFHDELDGQWEEQISDFYVDTCNTQDNGGAWSESHECDRCGWLHTPPSFTPSNDHSQLPRCDVRQRCRPWLRHGWSLRMWT